MTLFWERGQPARSAVYAELLTRRDTHKVLLISGVGCECLERSLGISVEIKKRSLRYNSDFAWGKIITIVLGKFITVGQRKPDQKFRHH